MRTESVSVKYQFTNEDLLNISREMARKRQDLIELENDEKQVKSEFKANLNLKLKKMRRRLK